MRNISQLGQSKKRSCAERRRIACLFKIYGNTELVPKAENEASTQTH